VGRTGPSQCLLTTVSTQVGTYMLHPDSCGNRIPRFGVAIQNMGQSAMALQSEEHSEGPKGL
jgi:hypothetical protein